MKFFYIKRTISEVLGSLKYSLANTSVLKIIENDENWRNFLEQDLIPTSEYCI